MKTYQRIDAASLEVDPRVVFTFDYTPPKLRKKIPKTFFYLMIVLILSGASKPSISPTQKIPESGWAAH